MPSAPEEVAGEIEGFARCVQQGDVGGEDVHDALPDMEFDCRTGLRRQIGVAARVVEQDLVLADVKQDGWQADRFAIER